MMRTLPRWTAAAALAFATVACSESATELADGNLTRSEVRSLAYGVSALGTSQTEDLAWSGTSFSVSDGAGASLSVSGGHPGGGPGGRGGVGGLGIWGPHRPGVHGTTTSTTQRTAPCPQGGTMESVTTITSVVDTVARTGKVTAEATSTPKACAFTVDSLNATLRTIANPGTVIAITGAPSLVQKSSSSYRWETTETSNGRRGRLVRGETTSAQTGSFRYTTSDNRSGTCAVDLKATFNPAERKHTVTGTFCGQAVNVSSTLPERGGRHGR